VLHHREEEEARGHAPRHRCCRPRLIFLAPPLVLPNSELGWSYYDVIFISTNGETITIYKSCIALFGAIIPSTHRYFYH
jgi:hypothetical protein